MNQLHQIYTHASRNGERKKERIVESKMERRRVTFIFTKFEVKPHKSQ